MCENSQKLITRVGFEPTTDVNLEQRKKTIEEEWTEESTALLQTTLFLRVAPGKERLAFLHYDRFTPGLPPCLPLQVGIPRGELPALFWSMGNKR